MERKGDKIRISPEVMMTFFQEAVDSIVNHVRDLLGQPACKGVDTIMMVGGFSDSNILIKAIEHSFSGLKLIVPKDAELAVLKGAVIFGHLPSVIRERVSKYTYGTDITPEFDKDQHEEWRRFVDDAGIARCIGVFDKLVEIGETMIVGEVQNEQTYISTTKKQKYMKMDIYKTKCKTPKYVNDEGCEKIARYAVPLSGTGVGREVTVRSIFGGTEIQFECVEMDTGNVTCLEIDFLHD